MTLSAITPYTTDNIFTRCSCTDASTTKLLGISPTTAHQFQTLFSASACVQPAAIKSPFHATGSARTAVGLFLLLIRRSGTHYPKTCGIQSVLWTVTDSHWRHFYFCSTSVFSALEVCSQCHDAVTDFEDKRVDALRSKRARRKAGVSTNPGVWVCDFCGRSCQSRIGLFTHRRTHRQ